MGLKKYLPEVFNIAVADVCPDLNQILSGPGFRCQAGAALRYRSTYEAARADFNSLARPRGVIAKVSIPEFETIYRSAEQDQQPTPVSRIFPRAQFIYLFAVTIGSGICRQINRRFQSRDLALGYMLDLIASAGTENTAAYVLNHLYDLPIRNRPPKPRTTVLDYNPGYCGWLMSGQKKLLARLNARQIGITLKASYLMEPIKSLSGALIAGPAEIHEVGIEFPCCADCKDRACRGRIRRIKEKTSPCQH